MQKYDFHERSPSQRKKAFRNADDALMNVFTLGKVMRSILGSLYILLYIPLRQLATSHLCLGTLHRAALNQLNPSCTSQQDFHMKERMFDRKFMYRYAGKYVG